MDKETKITGLSKLNKKQKAEVVLAAIEHWMACFNAGEVPLNDNQLPEPLECAERWAKKSHLQILAPLSLVGQSIVAQLQGSLGRCLGINRLTLSQFEIGMRLARTSCIHILEELRQKAPEELYKLTEFFFSNHASAALVMPPAKKSKR
ncbi:hypothetical protein B0H19DRAFT_1072154 [Mycena capillaripes]|nr:hypothetical protein B0H19DRAFT_1072154 [Mycena capillaripes]